MWIVLPEIGFLSVVLARKAADDATPDPDHLNVRARSRDHLERLQQLHPELASLEIVDSAPGADYPHRLVPVPKRVLADVVAGLVTDLSYTNVKSTAARAGPGGGFGSFMHEVWAAGRALTRRT